MNREPILILGDIIKDFMILNDDQIYIYNQNFNPTNTSGLFITLGFNNSVNYSSVNRFNPDTEQQELSINMKESYSINVYSKDSSSRIRKEEVIMALNSDLARNKQEEYFFQIAPITQGFVNVSDLEGEGMYNRFALNINILAHYNQVRDTLVYDTFNNSIENE